jgi:excisionase family DNA binding protein
MINLEDLLTAEQAAEYVGVSRQRIYALTKAGKLEGKRVGSTWLYTRAELDRWKAAPKHPGGRPKPGTALMTPVMVV